jgi:hypothetical protein
MRELWDRNGAIHVKRGQSLSAADIKGQLRAHPVTFVVANIGQPLTWVEPSFAFRFWKEEVQLHLVDPPSAEAGFSLESFPGGYAYVASEWSGGSAPAVVLLGMHH